MSTAAKPETIDLDGAEVARMLERIQPQISPEDHARVQAIARTLFDLQRLVRRQGTTIAGLRRLLGWSSSEKTADVCPGSPASGNGSDAMGPGTGEKPDAAGGGADRNDGDGDHGDQGGADDDDAAGRRKGHGRVPASAYPNGQKVAVGHEKLHPGDTCPECARGKLYPLSEPARIVRIFGQAPLAAAGWDLQRLRCSGCGDVFTAKAPEEAQGPKYDDSAASMMALMRYGTGMPLNRLAHLQKNSNPSTSAYPGRVDSYVVVMPPLAEEVPCPQSGHVPGRSPTPELR